MKTTVVLSGGMDSGTLLYEMISRGDEVDAVTVDYGQRHGKEIECARSLAEHVGVQWTLIDLSSVGRLLKGSSQTDPKVAVPHGRYDEPSMKQTVVPNRNMMLLAAAGAVAITKDSKTLAYGAHAGDHAIYPDCRPEFVEAMGKTFQLCDWSPLILEVPYLHFTKGEVCARGLALDVPYGMTWTCYEGLDVPCQRCGACVEREEAFEFAKSIDPLGVSNGR